MKYMCEFSWFNIRPRDFIPQDAEDLPWYVWDDIGHETNVTEITQGILVWFYRQERTE